MRSTRNTVVAGGLIALETGQLPDDSGRHAFRSAIRKSLSRRRFRRTASIPLVDRTAGVDNNCIWSAGSAGFGRFHPTPGAIGFDWVAAGAGGVSWLISWPRKKLIKKQLPKSNSLWLPN
jgi:hypothetical protein